MSSRSFAIGALVVAASLGAASQAPAQKPAHGFRLFAHALATMEVNRVSCGVTATGEVCVNATGWDVIGGGFWPKNSPQQYSFNSGMQVAGAIDPAAGFAWAGDTTGAFFFDPKGTTQHGAMVEPYWNYADSGDRAHWPQAAYVPQGDASAALFAPALQGRPSASEGDMWSLAWEGDTAQLRGRPHPLGVAMETRVLAWNFPGGNQDIIYFIHTFYNITSSCAADYAGVRPGLRDELLALGQRFQAMNDARFGIQIPACGYALRDLYFGSESDNDVSSDAGSNYASVNLPLRLRYTYQAYFHRTDNGYILPGDLSSPPFLDSYGFIGTQLLRTPLNGTSEAGVKLYSNFTGGGTFNDAPNTQALSRILSGTLNPALGDGYCNYDPTIDHICYVKNDGPEDERDVISTGPTTIPPGGSETVATAYVFASAVATTACPAPLCTVVPPGDPRFLSDAAHLTASGANNIDSITGFTGYVDDNGDGVVQGSEFRTVKNSLLRKAQLAQAIFDRHFLLPQAPDTPDFFLVPGDNSVAVLWRPSPTERTGDPYAVLASDPASPAYDPNYRQYDVEGYRVYRGRVDDPTRLTLLAQFDYADRDAAGHPLAMRDYLGVVNVRGGCAPELGRNGSANGCPITFQAPPAPRTPYTVYHEVPIVSDFVQVRPGDRFLKATGQVYITAADTAVTGGGSGRHGLWDTGVPFAFVDSTVKNSFEYFYSVVAFDVNSVQSGPSSLESARVLKPVTPEHPASNYSSTGGVATVRHLGRGVDTDSLHPADPTIDSVTGEFSGPARPATGASMQFVGDFLSRVVRSPGDVTVTLLDLVPGSVYDGIPAEYTFSAGLDTVALSVLPSSDAQSTTTEASFSAYRLDPALASRYGGGGGYVARATFGFVTPGGYLNGSYGRGCLNGSHYPSRCGYDGARWFAGANESFPDPTQGNGPNGPTPGSITNATNAGSLPGVAHAFEPRAYQTRPNVYRAVEGVFSTISTAADYRVYWGSAAGSVDSVVDITHNVPVVFDTTAARGYTWGFLTQGATAGTGSGDHRPGVLTVSDLGCVAPLHTFPAADQHLGCASATHYAFTNVATPGALVIGVDSTDDQLLAPRPHPGFGMYLAGHFFLFELTGASAPSKTVWTLRTYVGGIAGGGDSCAACTGGAQGPYRFFPSLSPFTAVGASLRLHYTVTNRLASAQNADLAEVHTVPDPYYVTNAFETDATHKVVKFVNLPAQAIIRIYTTSGILVRVLEHNSGTFLGTADWDLRNRGGRLVANGVYFWAIEAGNARRVGRMTIVSVGR